MSYLIKRQGQDISPERREGRNVTLRVQSLQIHVVQDVQAGVAAEVHHQLTLVLEAVDEVEGEGRFGVILDGDLLVVRTTNQFEGKLRQDRLASKHGA